MKRLVIAALATFILTAPASAHWWNRKAVTVPIVSEQPAIVATVGMAPVTAATDPLAQFNDAIHKLLNGSTSLPQFTLDDLNNMKAIYQAKADKGGPSILMDKQGVLCANQLIAFQPQLAALTTPPTLAVDGAPVTGFFSGIAAAQVKAETAKAQAAAYLALIQNGLPPEVTIACAPIFTNPAAMFSLHP